MQNFLEKGSPIPRYRYWKTPVKPDTSAKKSEKTAKKKPSATPKTRKVWQVKQKRLAPSPPETGGKSAN